METTPKNVITHQKHLGFPAFLNIHMQNPNRTENQACTLSHGALLEEATHAIVNSDSR